jgi:hypothetical protein
VNRAKTLELLLAWMASALAGSFAYTTVFVLTELLRADLVSPYGLRWSPDLLTFILPFFAIGLIFQLIYGGLLYLGLKGAGLFNFPVLLLGYLVPALATAWFGSSSPEKLLMSAPLLLSGSVMAAVTWYCAPR